MTDEPRRCGRRHPEHQKVTCALNEGHPGAHQSDKWALADRAEDDTIILRWEDE